jgi:hypothetical protein
MDKEKIVSEIFKELRRAENKFPVFPSDPIHASAILAEECGELQQACLQWTYEGGESQHVIDEAVQCAAMSLRFLFNVDNMKTRPSE